MAVPLVAHLNTDGLGGYLGGTHEMAIDASAEPVEFKLGGYPTLAPIHVGRIIVFARLGGSLDAGGYGNAAELRRGLTISANGRTLTPTPIRAFADWTAYAYDPGPLITPAGGEARYLASRWSFNKFTRFEDGGLIIEPGQTLTARIHDDLSGLASHIITAEGWY